MKLAVIGGSRATNHGLDENFRPFPLIMDDLTGDDGEVRSWAKTGLMLHRFMPSVGEVVSFQPDMILVLLGAREAHYRIPRRMKKLPIPISQPIAGRGFWLPRSWLRRQVWRSIVWPLQHHPRLGERFMQLLRLRPYRTPEQYRTTMTELMTALAPTGARIVIFEYFQAFQSQYISKPSYRAAHTKYGRELAAASGGRILTLDPKEMGDFSSFIISDGVHLSEEGHRVIARALLEQLQALDSRGQLEVDSRRQTLNADAPQG